MCCTRVETDVLLANIMISKNYKGSELTVNDLANCARYLANHMPGYLDSDVSLARVEEVVAMYPELFNFDGVFVKQGKFEPRVEFFNQRYSKEKIRWIGKIIDRFLSNYDGQKVLLLRPILL